MRRAAPLGVAPVAPGTAVRSGGQPSAALAAPRRCPGAARRECRAGPWRWPLVAGPLVAVPVAFRRRRVVARVAASADPAVYGRGERARAALHQSITEYLQSIGGQSRLDSLREVYPVEECPEATEWFLRAHFDFDPSFRREMTTVSLRASAERAAREADSAAERVARQLLKVGGSADLHDITRRFGVSRDALLAHGGGRLFEASGGRLRLAGGLGAVAAAAAASGRATDLPGRRRSPDSLLTSAGAATDAGAARRLLLRVEGLLASAGDGALPARSVYHALGLRPSPALRRWFRRAGLQLSSAGELRVAEDRLAFFRVQRGLRVAALLAEAGGPRIPLAAALSRIHRPPELAELESEEGGCASAPEPGPRPPGGGYGHRDYGGGAAGGPPERLAIVSATPPPWIEAWARRYFDVWEGGLGFPAGPAPARPPPAGLGLAEEEAMLARVQEELRLRYGRAHVSVLTGCFKGVRQAWLRRFFDISPYGDVLPKGGDRQVREAVAIAARAVEGGAYSAEEAFRDFGATRPWLRAFFQVGPDGLLALEGDPWRAWRPPARDSAPSPWSYAKLKAPRGYIRKGNGRYLPRKYGHSAGGILY